MSRATVHVGLGDRAYEVLVGPGLIDGAGGLIAPLLKRKRVAVVTDNIVGDYHGERLAFALERGGVSVDTIVVPAGEETKSFAGLEALSAKLLALKLDRGDMIVAFGGGVVGDLAGFAAAIYKRGIDFIQIPTTLLAQVDSSVGGKTAIDTPAGKNLVGAFHQPRLVLADLDVLCTLSDREMACGYAEVVKYGLLGDRAFFDWLEAHGAQVLARRNAELTHAVARSVQMKAEIVAEDEREVGRRALLNLGHTFGHALESETGFGEALKHGEAVAAGCAQAFRFSARLGLCPPADADRAEKVFRDAHLPTRLEHLPRQGLNADALIDHMAQDKKAISGRLTFILARSIGDAIVSRDVDAATVRDFLVSEGAKHLNIWAIVGALGPSLIVLLGIGALISAAETSMTASSRGRMHQLERDGDRAARRVNLLMSDQENMIGAILLSNNVVNIGASALTTSVLAAAFPGPIGAVAATAIMTVLIVIFGEILPKTLAITRPDDVARAMSLPTYWVVKIFGPLARGAQWVVRKTLGLFGIQMSMETDVLAAHEEIRGAVEYHHSEGLVESRDRWMLGGVLDLSDRDVSQVMVHRKSITMLDADEPPRVLIAQALESGHSRVPLYRDEPENIVGVLHAKDLLRALAAPGADIETLDLAGMAREPWFIPDTTKLKDQLAAFLKRQSHFALVVDEYGGLQGLVTLEDILEEIVGEIEDEHDTAVTGVRRQPDGSVHIDGDVAVRDLNRLMDWDLPEDEAVTIAGLVIHEAQAIPDPGQTFIFHHHRFQVLRRSRNQITALRVSARLVDQSTQ